MPDDTLSRFARSWRLIGASWEVLRAERKLVILPAISGLASLLVIAVFIAPVFGAAVINPAQLRQDLNEPGILLYAWLFLFYVVQYFVVIFFNTALVGAALDRLNGGDPTISSALALATRRINAIFGYAVIAATVGVLLRALSERLGFIGRLLGLAFELGWTVATFLVVPVLAAEDIGPIAAIEHSVELLRRSWGENLIGRAGISLAMSLLMTMVVAVGFAAWIIGFNRGQPLIGIVLFAAAGVLALVIVLVGAALSAVYQAALYYYAVAGEPPRGFDRDLLRGAFGPKGAR